MNTIVKRKSILFLVITLIFILNMFLISSSSIRNSFDHKKEESIIEEKGQREEQFGDLKTSMKGWGKVELISTESTENSLYPSIAVDGDENVHVAWIDDFLLYKCWNSTTGIWMVAEEVASTSYVHTDIAVDSEGNIHIVWSGGGFHYKCRNKTTGTWMTVEEDFSGGSYRFSLDVDNSDNVYLLWHNGKDLVYKYRNATTGLWIDTELIVRENVYEGPNSIGFDNLDNFYVVWYDYTGSGGSGEDGDIFFRYLNVTTQVWSAGEVVSTESTDYSTRPCIAVEGSGRVHCIWQDHTNGSSTHTNAFYKNRNPITGTWTTTEVLSTDFSGAVRYPAIDLDPFGNVHVIWDEDGTLFYKQRNPSSTNWTSIERVADGTHGTPSSLAVDGSGIPHTVFRVYSNYSNSGDDTDIFYRKRIDVPNIPILQKISPNPDHDGKISLDWNDIENATEYLVYREDTKITSAFFLTPLANISVSNFQDKITKNGTYYYAIVASNSSGPSPVSNCESVEVILPPSAPVLDFISPDPDFDGTIELNWTDVKYARNYYVYRNSSTITSTKGLTPISNVSKSSYDDVITSNGEYYYVVVAENIAGNSSISNCEDVTVIVEEETPDDNDDDDPNDSKDGGFPMMWTTIIIGISAGSGIGIAALVLQIRKKRRKIVE